MASLTTVYILSIVLASLSGIGSAFAGHTFYQWGGSGTILPPEPKSEPDLKKLLEKETTKEVAESMVEFIETPVMEWKKIAPSFRELVQKYVSTATHPDKNKCPPKLLKICNLVSVKFSRMRDFIRSEAPDSLGNQTSEALAILQNTE